MQRAAERKWPSPRPGAEGGPSCLHTAEPAPAHCLPDSPGHSKRMSLLFKTTLVGKNYKPYFTNEEIISKLLGWEKAPLWIPF